MFAGLILGLLAIPASAKDENSCRKNQQCDAQSYCAKAAGECKSKGMCKPRPEVCTQIFEPVRGCDGQTYSNACQAASAGVNVASEGECSGGDDPGEPKGCRSNDDCMNEEFCKKPGMSCKSVGACEERPDFCTQEVDPVCGCDDKTYSNACTAEQAGVNVKRKGEC